LERLYFGQMRTIGLWPFLTIIVVAIICSTTVWIPVIQAGQQEPMTRKDINAVLEEHDDQLLAIPGVVGVYIGLLPDDETPCLKVMVIKETEDLKRRIPTSIDGYPVLIEEAGVIRPLKNPPSPK
jgi:hypothetical protein